MAYIDAYIYCRHRAKWAVAFRRLHTSRTPASMDNKWHLHIPLESFAVSYALHRESVGDRPIVPQVQLSEGKPIALYSLLREVLEREGCHVVSGTRSLKSHRLSTVLIGYAHTFLARGRGETGIQHGEREYVCMVEPINRRAAQDYI